MAPADNVAVVISPPSFDLNPYKPFDEELFERTVDEILSEEVSLEELRKASEIENSFSFGNDGSSGLSSVGAYRCRDNTAKKSPYFFPPSFAKGRKSKVKTYATKRSITMMDPETDDEEDMDAESVDEPRTGDVSECETNESSGNQLAFDLNVATGDMMQTSVSGPDPSIDQHPNGTDDDQSVEDAVFASVTPSQRDHLIQFVGSHSFMQELQPLRSARREFTDQVRTEAMQAGMDETAIDDLIDYVRSTYREIHRIESSVTTTERDGSAFGDEIDDERNEKTRRSSSKNRKRSLDGTETKKSKRSKKNKKRLSDESHVHNSTMSRVQTMQVVKDGGYSGGILSKPQGGENRSAVDEHVSMGGYSDVSANLDKSNEAEKWLHVEGSGRTELTASEGLGKGGDFTILEKGSKENISREQGNYSASKSTSIPEIPQPDPETSDHSSLKASKKARKKKKRDNGTNIHDSTQPEPEGSDHSSLKVSKEAGKKKKKDNGTNIHDSPQPEREAPGSHASKPSKRERNKKRRERKHKKELRDSLSKSDLDPEDSHIQVQVPTPAANNSARKDSDTRARRPSYASLSSDPGFWELDF